MKSENRHFLISLMLIVLLSIIPGRNLSAQHVMNLKWNLPYQQTGPDGTSVSWLSCDDCYTSTESGLPVFAFEETATKKVVSVDLTNDAYLPLSEAETQIVKKSEYQFPALIKPDFETVYDRGRPSLRISLVPLRKNPENGHIEKLISFTLNIQTDGSRAMESATIHEYAPASVLSSGDWFRISLEKDGLYQLSYSDLAAMGVAVSGISSSQLRIHGYGGGMLPERVGDTRYDDLPEIPLMVMDGGDGRFDAGDYLVFYGQGLRNWKFDAQADLFKHQEHLYSDESFYFITTGQQPGRRIEEFPQPQGTPGAIISSYNWFDAYEPNEANMVKSGKEWYGDVFDIVNSRNYTFADFDPDLSYPLTIRLSTIARSTAGSSFALTGAGGAFSAFIAPIVTDFNTVFARASNETFQIEQPALPIAFNLKYNKNSNSATGWLNFIEVNAMGKLTYNGSQMNFRRTGQQGIVEYRLTGVDKPVQVWDVTDPVNPGKINASIAGSNLKFTALADELREYVISDQSSYLNPVFVEKVANQNLHGLQPYSMVIITHPLFAGQAERLATFHAQHDNLDVLVVQPQTIYNEFSSGTQDISAIRDFVKMLWERSSTGGMPRFLLLFGDASYDPKDRMNNNSNFIPVYLSPESLHPVTSYVTDDFFGCIDNNEGGLTADVLDIGVGRLPVQTVAEAEMAVDKIIHYATDTEKVNGDWRNVISFVADDGDGNSHMMQADELARMIDTAYRNYNVDKIFLDAYNQISTPGGQRVPDATAAINQRMDKGALIINYTGHGGEVGWTHERVLEVTDINGWTNYDRMPVFMTATCEFSRYDDPVRASAGELVFLNPNGGGIALFTTSRPTYGTPNFALARSFYNIALSPDGDGMPHLGDLIRNSKRVAGADNNSKKFVLLGDPAMKMAYPTFNVITRDINGAALSRGADTLKALSEIVVNAYVADLDNSILTDFNGEVSIVVFDKENQIRTFGTENAAPMTFGLRKSIIYKGKVKVVNGAFTYSFIVPLDIAYQYGKGKISYYATDGVRDAAGQYSGVVVGGFSDRQTTDISGPEIALYMNHVNFRRGGFTDENPVMLAVVNDQSGINTIGNGIGHDIVAIIDDQSDSPYVLNDSYLSDLNTYKSGVITFPFHNLSVGRHTLRLKVWDVNNNSSEATTEFVVASSEGLALENLEAWPNPMSDHVTIEFDHNQAGQELAAQLDIYSLEGNRAATLNRLIFASGFRTVGFEWDGRGSNGHLLSSGFYIGRLRITTTDGLTSEKSVKIIIAR